MKKRNESPNTTMMLTVTPMSCGRVIPEVEYTGLDALEMGTDAYSN